MLATLTGNAAEPIHAEIIFNFRMPKAIVAILAGVALSVAGLLMQTLFRNPLADPYILGVSSGTGLGVAITMMSASVLPAFWINSSWGIVFSAVFGAALVLLLVIGVSYKLQSAVSLLIVGIMFGTIASSIVSILQYFSNPDAIKLFVLWTFGSLSAVTPSASLSTKLHTPKFPEIRQIEVRAMQNQPESM
ncbi:MAG: iron ABC transporter permease [Pigmentiphaga sp.]|nr:iron ABC transporter permease [Pigmentiphaga sp.]